MKDEAVVPGWEDKIVAWVESEPGTQCWQRLCLAQEGTQDAVLPTICWCPLEPVHVDYISMWQLSWNCILLIINLQPKYNVLTKRKLFKIIRDCTLMDFILISKQFAKSWVYVFVNVCVCKNIRDTNDDLNMGTFCAKGLEMPIMTLLWVLMYVCIPEWICSRELQLICFFLVTFYFSFIWGNCKIQAYDIYIYT